MPLTIFVTKLENAGETSFMAVIKPNEEEAAISLVTCTPKGVATLVNAPFLDMFGHGATFVGQSALTLFARSSAAQVDAMIAEVAESADEELTVTKQVEAVHHNRTLFPASVTVSRDRSEAVKGGNKNLVVLKIIALNDRIGMMTIDESGNIVSANSFLTDVFGYSQKELLQLNVASLMPRPFSRFHNVWVKRYLDTGVPHIVGAEIGRTVLVRTAPRPDVVFSLSLTGGKHWKVTGRKVFPAPDLAAPPTAAAAHRRHIYRASTRTAQSSSSTSRFR